MKYIALAMLTFLPLVEGCISSVDRAGSSDCGESSAEAKKTVQLLVSSNSLMPVVICPLGWQAAQQIGFINDNGEILWIEANLYYWKMQQGVYPDVLLLRSKKRLGAVEVVSGSEIEKSLIIKLGRHDAFEGPDCLNESVQGLFELIEKRKQMPQSGIDINRED